MKDFFKKIPEQAVRVIVLFVILAVGMFVVRQFIIPPEMKEMALIQTATMEREATKEVKYAGAQSLRAMSREGTGNEEKRLPPGSVLRILPRRRAKTRRQSNGSKTHFTEKARLLCLLP